MKKDDYLALDVGGTYIKYAIVDHSGLIQTVDKLRTPSDQQTFLQVIFKIIRKYETKIKGIGVSCPGKIDIEKGIIYFGGALTFLDKLPLKQRIEDEFTIPCALSNDGKAATLAEMWIGNLKDVDYGATIVLGTGVGGGIVANGELLAGNHFQAGELSFILNKPYSKPNQYRDFVGYSLSAVQFVRRCAEVLELSDLDDGQAVFASINANDNAKVRQYFEAYCHELAVLIVTLQAVIDVKKIVIGGGISAQDSLVIEIKRQYQLLLKDFPMLTDQMAQVEIEHCKFKNNANLLGAIYQLLLQMEITSKGQI